MGFLWDLSQNLKISGVQADANRANYKADRAGRRVATSAESVARLVTILRAMWELLSENTLLTEADLEARVNAIDLRDGRLDARYRPDRKPYACARCGRTVHPSQVRCQFTAPIPPMGSIPSTR